MNSNDIIESLWQCIQTGEAPDESTIKAVERALSKAEAPGFEGFWQIYPRKQKKADARKAWVQVSKMAEFDPARVIKDVTTRAKTDKQWCGDKSYIPLASSYLRGERWHDEIIHAEPQRKKLPNNPAELLQLAERLGIITLGLSEFDLRRAIQEKLG